MMNGVRGVIGAPNSTLAKPYPFDIAILPFWNTPTAHRARRCSARIPNQCEAQRIGDRALGKPRDEKIPTARNAIVEADSVAWVPRWTFARVCCADRVVMAPWKSRRPVETDAGDHHLHAEVYHAHHRYLPRRFRLEHGERIARVSGDDDRRGGSARVGDDTFGLNTGNLSRGPYAQVSILNRN
jgi:hypothetical protein